MLAPVQALSGAAQPAGVRNVRVDVYARVGGEAELWGVVFDAEAGVREEEDGVGRGPEGGCGAEGAVEG